MDKRTIKLGNRKLEVEIATTPLEKMKGMSFREEGKMLFVFDKDVKDPLHMATLSVPLQMIFFNSRKDIIDIQRAEPWTMNPLTWKTYKPDTSYRFVLESTDFLDLEIGGSFEFID